MKSGAVSGFDCIFIILEIRSTHSKTSRNLLTISLAGFPTVSLLWESASLLLHGAHCTDVKEFSDARSHRRLNFVLWRLIFMRLWWGSLYTLLAPRNFTWLVKLLEDLWIPIIIAGSKYWALILIAWLVVQFSSQREERSGPLLLPRCVSTSFWNLLQIFTKIGVGILPMRNTVRRLLGAHFTWKPSSDDFFSRNWDILSVRYVLRTNKRFLIIQVIVPCEVRAGAEETITYYNRL